MDLVLTHAGGYAVFPGAYPSWSPSSLTSLATPPISGTLTMSPTLALLAAAEEVLASPVQLVSDAAAASLSLSAPGDAAKGPTVG